MAKTKKTNAAEVEPASKKRATEKNDTRLNTNENEGITTLIAKKKSSAKEELSAVRSKPTPKPASPDKAKASAKASLKTTISEVRKKINIQFQLKFHTSYGQELFITGDHPLFGHADIEKAIPMHFLNEDNWTATIEWPAGDTEKVFYNYLLKNADGSTVTDWGQDHFFSLNDTDDTALLIMDNWNHAGYFENIFYTPAFQQVLLKPCHTSVKTKTPKKITHQFKVKSPLLEKGQTLCIIGADKLLGNWSTSEPLLLQKEEASPFYTIRLDLSKASFPLAYKYGIYDTVKKHFVVYEGENNRILYDTIAKKKTTIVQDGFARFAENKWKGAGVAIPVFSLKSSSGFGVGEFQDLKLLADWAAIVGLKMIQILPVNDTTATHSWKDSYPYAAISAFALHPIYLNLDAIAEGKHAKALQKLSADISRLNEMQVVDYDGVIQLKTHFLKKIYKDTGVKILSSAGFEAFFQLNKHWLIPYAVFCYLRDEYGTVDFDKWPAYRHYKEADIIALANESSSAYTDIAYHYFVQYQLHCQLKDATDYAHSKGVIVKGDIAIGVYRYGADTWQNPELFHMNFQAGAPPDDFAVNGQNWGFPTYNWQRMQEDGFAWWKQRFAQMNHYFDAFRIDHILGFFRIWSIPMHAVQGIMGHFVPAIPVHINEFNQQGIWFDHERYTKPFITDGVLWEEFGYDNELVKSIFLDTTSQLGNYTLKPSFSTQKKVEEYFAVREDDVQHQKIKQGLYNLISNVILFDADGDGQSFHFRFNIEKTTSFRYLEWKTQEQLKSLYIQYFFRKQDEFWKKEALQKLPALKRGTNMIVCGEDLGLVPACVPDVMQQLGLLSLEIQRMPKNPEKEFFHPNDAPYLSVVTPSTHDMSTIRGWWEEDRARIQRFYNQELGQWGDAPVYCEAWINKAIVLQHLYSPAMWSIFQLQDLMGMHEALRREYPTDEQINIPANPNHYWRYRMHLNLEELKDAKDFNEELLGMIHSSKR